MKKNIILLIAALAIISCDKREIMTYNGGHYLSFSLNPAEDSTETSFFFYPDNQTLRVPIAVNLGGGPLGEQRQYKVVAAEGTNALEKNFEIETPVVRKGLIRDTVWVKITRSDELSLRKYRLVLAIQPDDFFQLGQTEYRTAKVIFSSLASQPTWWTKAVADAYLGVYSDLKYATFVRVTDGRAAYFGERLPAEQRQMAIEFLNYLRKEKDAGRTVYEEDGKTEMTVTVRA